MKIGIADTMFARVNMAEAALKAVEQEKKSKGLEIQVERYTVPGFKDLPVACKRLFEDFNCDAVVALGWCGAEKIDEQCAHEANLGLMSVQIEAKKHILTAFFHETETNELEKQKKIAWNRAFDHALNAIALVKGKEELSQNAGQGVRQGYENAGEIEA